MRFRARIRDFEDRGTDIVGISFDSVEANRRFRGRYALPYDLLSDADRSVSIAYGASRSQSWIPSRKSVLVGPDGRVAMSYGRVSVFTHAATVLADIDALP